MIPADDLARVLALSAPGQRPSYSVAGDTYTILIPGEATGGSYAAIDMHVPPGGGPDPRRHACEELFWVLKGEIELFFRDQRLTAGPGVAINVPANAPYMFKNLSRANACVLNLVSPASLDAFFAAGGVPAPTEGAPALDASDADAQKRCLGELASRFGAEFLAPDTFDHL